MTRAARGARIAFGDPRVAAVFAAYPPVLRARLTSLRELVLDVARLTEGVGPLEETLKWGQPSYLTSCSGSGTLIRMDRLARKAGSYALFFHCQTTLIDSFRGMFPGELRFEGNRCIVFHEDEVLPEEAVRHCVRMALTYRVDRRRSNRAG